MLKAGFKLREVERALPYLTSHTKKFLINCIVMPYINYCSEIWSSANRACLKRLEKQFNASQSQQGKNCDQKEIRFLENMQKNMALMTFKEINDLTPVY